MKTLFLAALLLTSISSAAYAGYDWSERGNGGDVVVCPATNSHVMLDLHEAYNRYGYNLVLNSIPTYGFPFKVAPDELVEIAKAKIENNLRHLDASLTKKLLLLLRDFNKSVKYLRDGNFLDVPDSGHVELPEGCHLRQLVVQIYIPTSDEKLYLVSYDLWVSMRYPSRLAAILHEVIYHAALDINPKLKDSEKLRYFNSLILADQLKKLTPTEYRKVKMRMLGLH